MNDLCSLKNIIEAALLAADRPLSIDQIWALFDEEVRPSHNQIQNIIKELVDDWGIRAIELKEVHSGYRFQVRQEIAPWISRLWEEKPSRHSRAFLETLALIAYRQPITRAEVEEIRGVSVSSGIIRSLQEREWVRTVGHRETPGRPALYGTTRKFLDQFNLKSLNELPPLAEIKALNDPQIKLKIGMEFVVEKAAEEANQKELMS